MNSHCTTGGVIVAALNTVGVPVSKAPAEKTPTLTESTLAEFDRAERNGFVRIFPTAASSVMHIPTFKAVDPTTMMLCRLCASMLTSPASDISLLAAAGGVNELYYDFQRPNASSFLKKKSKCKKKLSSSKARAKKL